MRANRRIVIIAAPLTDSEAFETVRPMSKPERNLNLVPPVYIAATWLRADLDSVHTQTRSPEGVIAVVDEC